MKALIMDIDHFAVHDGPGIRTSIYFKGCPLSCTWCHSPESQSAAPEILYTAARCVLCGKCVSSCPKNLHQINEKGHSFSRGNCDTCGDCARVCPQGALSISGKEKTLDEVLAEALSDEVFYKNSGGGVTLSGGEVLLQGSFVKLLLDELKRRGIHTIVETAGYGSKEDLLAMADSASLFYFDFKLADPQSFKHYIGLESGLIWDNLESLRRKTASIVLRVPLIPTITDKPENIAALYRLAAELKIATVHLLPYNYSAGAKYEWVGRDYPLDFLKDQSQVPEDLLAIDHPGVEALIVR
ncbi:glycyl-radical enzyme activating protein [Spirochaetia bacterium]|nr:glycyl-radical enzyme activating protein [Spirochaetia bacterium]